VALKVVRCRDLTMADNTFFGKLDGFTPGDHPKNVYLAPGGRPKGTWSFVRPNAYEKGRAHVAIYNWDRRGSVEVDLSSSGLSAGDRYEIRDAQEYHGTPVGSGTFDGAPVRIAMDGRSIARPLGSVAFPPRHTSSEFGAFVVLKTVDGVPRHRP